jgi:predicted 3-demethylubiquinone-9 3-methyltransferase (glyoxalase superfamily)
MTHVTPFLWFDQQAEEAVHYYIATFKNAAITDIVRYGEGGMGVPGTVMTISFELDGQPFTALNGGPTYQINPAVSFVIHCADQAEVDHYWERLGDGGKPGPCGWVEDRFGVSWQVVPDELIALLADPDPERAERVTKAMLAMGKLDIPTLRRARDEV